MTEQRILEEMEAAGIDLVTMLPCDRIKHLIPLVEQRFNTVALTREEVGVGICAGAALAGARPAMLIQSTGAGTLANALCSLPLYFGLPLPMLISWRGHHGETIAAQVPLGRALPGLFAACGIDTEFIENTEDVPKIGEAINRAFDRSVPVAILLSPELFDAGAAPSAPPPQRTAIRPAPLPDAPLPLRGDFTRQAIIETMAPHFSDTAVVVNIGVPCKEYHHAADGDNVFYMLGSLGLASAIGIGLAAHTDKPVAVIDGDGSLLMTPNVFQHMAELATDNFMCVCIDNGVYGSTGNQPTAADAGLDLTRIARAYGVTATHTVNDLDEVGRIAARKPWPRFCHVRCSPGNAPVPNLRLSAETIRDRFTGWLR